jgi:RNA polymerase sigma-70 factor (ECF subfamily)
MIDPHHFEAFMKAYQNMVFTTAVRLLGNETDAEDIAQEVFLKAYERFADLGQSPSVGGWLKTVAVNLSLNHLSRYRARWRFFSEMTSKDDDNHYADSLAGPDTFENELATSDHRKLLDHALAKLPKDQRVPLVLYHFEELSYEQIASKLGVSLSKVKTDIHRGRISLRRKIELSPGLQEYPRTASNEPTIAKSSQPASASE